MTTQSVGSIMKSLNTLRSENFKTHLTRDQSDTATLHIHVKEGKGNKKQTKQKTKKPRSPNQTKTKASKQTQPPGSRGWRIRGSRPTSAYSGVKDSSGYIRLSVSKDNKAKSWKSWTLLANPNFNAFKQSFDLNFWRMSMINFKINVSILWSVLGACPSFWTICPTVERWP